MIPSRAFISRQSPPFEGLSDGHVCMVCVTCKHNYEPTNTTLATGLGHS
jgi:hypothetical protein